MSDGDRTESQGLLARLGGRRGWCSGAAGAGNGAGRKKRGELGRSRGSFCHPFRGVLGEYLPDDATLLKQKIFDMERTLSAMKTRLDSLKKDGE